MGIASGRSIGSLVVAYCCRAICCDGMGGFDERFFYHYEEVDLCYRVWESGCPIRFTPEVTITHLGGQSVGRFPVRFALEINRNCYRYYYKHFGEKGARQCRLVTLAHLRIRQVIYGFMCWFKPTESLTVPYGHVPACSRVEHNAGSS